MQRMIVFWVCLLASGVGAIVGVGGGVIIKPVMDALGVASVSTIRFLSGCTVLGMSGFSVVRSLAARESRIRFAISTPLAAGAALGGVLGNQLFTLVRGLFENQNTVGAVQALVLFVVELGTMLYTLNKAKIRTRKLTHPLFCALIGMLLGMLSSFLGIGGGPINLVVLSYLFSMDSKTAAQNSLYIILFSQLVNLIMMLAMRTVPSFEPVMLILMLLGGVLGAALGRRISRALSARWVDRLLLALLLVILGINAYNVFQFAGLQ